MVPKKTWIILLVVAAAISSIPVFAQSQLGLINYSLDHLVAIQTVEQFQQGNQKLITINLLYEYPSNASLAVQPVEAIIEDPTGELLKILIIDGAGIYKEQPFIDTTPAKIIIVEEEEVEIEPTPEEIAEALGIPTNIQQCLYGAGPFAAFQSKSAFDITSLTFTQGELQMIRDNLSQNPHVGKIKKAIEACKVMDKYYNILSLIGQREIDIAEADAAGLDFHGRNITALTNRGNDPTKMSEVFDQEDLDAATKRAEEFKCSPEGRALGHCYGDKTGINRGSPYDPAKLSLKCQTIYLESGATKLICPIQDMLRYFTANPQIEPSVAQKAQVFAAQKQLCFDTWEKYDMREVHLWPDVLRDGTCDLHLNDEKYTETITFCSKGGERVQCSEEVRKAGN